MKHYHYFNDLKEARRFRDYLNDHARRLLWILRPNFDGGFTVYCLRMTREEYNELIAKVS